MKKMTRKIVSILLTLCLVLGVMPPKSAKAETYLDPNVYNWYDGVGFYMTNSSLVRRTDPDTGKHYATMCINDLGMGLTPTIKYGSVFEDFTPTGELTRCDFFDINTYQPQFRTSSAPADQYTMKITNYADIYGTNGYKFLWSGLINEEEVIQYDGQQYNTGLQKADIIPLNGNIEGYVNLHFDTMGYSLDQYGNDISDDFRLDFKLVFNNWFYDFGGTKTGTVKGYGTLTVSYTVKNGNGTLIRSGSRVYDAATDAGNPAYGGPRTWLENNNGIPTQLYKVQRVNPIITNSPDLVKEVGDSVDWKEGITATWGRTTSNTIPNMGEITDDSLNSSGTDPVLSTDGANYNGIGTVTHNYTVKDEHSLDNTSPMYINDKTKTEVSRKITVKAPNYKPDLEIQYTDDHEIYKGEWLSTDNSADSDRKRTVDFVVGSDLPGTYSRVAFGTVGGTLYDAGSVTDKTTTTKESGRYTPYSTESATHDGTEIKAKLMDSGKTVDLSGITDAKIVKFDNTVPNVAVTHSGGDNSVYGSLSDNSSDVGPSGLDSTYVAFVQSGSAPPNYNDSRWEKISEVSPKPSTTIKYDIYSYAKDKATNKSQVALVAKNVEVAAPDIEVTKTVDKDTAQKGDTLTYTITVTNNGAGVANNWGITDELGSGLEYISDDAGGSNNGQVTTWKKTIPDKNSANNSIVIKLKAKVTGLTGTVKNTVVATNPNNSEDEKKAEATTTLLRPDVTVKKTADKTQVAEDDIITYTIKLENTGAGDAKNFEVKDVLGEGLSYDSSSPQGTNSGNTTTWAVDVDAGATKNLTLRAKVTAKSGTVKNNVQVTDPDEPNKQMKDDIETPVVNPDVTVKKIADKTHAEKSEEIEYTIIISNNSIAKAKNWKITDTLDQNLTFVAEDGNGTRNGQVISWTKDIPANGSVTIKVKAKPSVDKGTVRNDVKVEDPDDPDTSDSDHAVVTVHEPKVTISKTGPATAEKGDRITYEIIVKNNGQGVAQNWEVVDTLDDDLEYVSCTGGGTYKSSDKSIEWNPTISAGQEVTYSVVAKVTGKSGTITNDVTATNPNDPDDSDAAEAKTTILEPQIEINKRVDKSEAEKGDELTYTLTIKNKGQGKAEGWIIEDTLDNGLEFVSEDGNGSRTGQDIKWIKTIAPGATEVITVKAKITSKSGIVKNILTAIDPDDQNNKLEKQVETTVLEPQISISKLTDVADAQYGDELEYKIVVKNSGKGEAKDYEVKDVLGTGLEYVSSTKNGTNNGQETTWKIDVPSNDSVTLGLKARVTKKESGEVKNVVTSDDGSDEEVTKIVKPEIKISKTADVAEAQKGDLITYTLKVKNEGDGTARNWNIFDELTNGIEYVSDDGSGTYDDATKTIKWNRSIEPDDEIEFKVVAKVKIEGSADVVSPAKTVNTLKTENPKDPTDTKEVKCEINIVKPKVTVKKTSDLEVAQPGDEISYKIIVKNEGTGVARNETITDALSDGLRYISDDRKGKNSGQETVWVMDIPAGGEEEINLKAKVTSAKNITQGKNKVAVKSGAEDEVSTKIVRPAITVTKTADKKTAVKGDVITYIIKVVNNGDGDANNFRIEDILDDELKYVSDDSNGVNKGQITTWIKDIPKNGGETSIELKAEVITKGSADSSKKLLAGNKVKVTNPKTNDTEEDETDVSLLSSNVTIKKTCSKTSAKVGDILEYTLEVENTGTADAKDITVQDMLGVGLEYVSDDSNGKNDGSKTTWTLSLEKAESKTIILKARVTQMAEATVMNKAETEDDKDEVKTDILKPNIKLSKTSDAPKEGVKQGDEIEFTITAKNNGKIDAQNLIIKDTLSEGLDYISDSADGRNNGRETTWIKDIKAGETLTITLRAKVSILAGKVRNAVEISDPLDPGNGTYTVTPEIEVKPDVYIITYDLNGGSYKGSKADITETYPAGTVIKIHAKPEREGYKFLYWKGSEYQPGDSYTVNSDHTFTAQWEKVEPESMVDKKPSVVQRTTNNSADTSDVASLDMYYILLVISSLIIIGIAAALRRKRV